MKISFLKKSILLALVATSFAACHMDKSKPNFEPIQDMMEQDHIKAQEYDETSPQHRGMRTPPPHTVPVGFFPYKCPGDVDCANKLVNPIAGDMKPETLIVGQKYFETHCAVCHGFEGKGDGTVAEKMPLRPPSLISDKVKGFTDGHVYHIITEGQGVMGPYKSHVPQKYRWQVVNYIRNLQKQN